MVWPKKEGGRHAHSVHRRERQGGAARGTASCRRGSQHPQRGPRTAGPSGGARPDHRVDRPRAGLRRDDLACGLRRTRQHRAAQVRCGGAFRRPRPHPHQARLRDLPRQHALDLQRAGRGGDARHSQGDLRQLGNGLWRLLRAGRPQARVSADRRGAPGDPRRRLRIVEGRGRGHRARHPAPQRAGHLRAAHLKRLRDRGLPPRFSSLCRRPRPAAAQHLRVHRRARPGPDGQPLPRGGWARLPDLQRSERRSGGAAGQRGDPCAVL